MTNENRKLSQSFTKLYKLVLIENDFFFLLCLLYFTLVLWSFSLFSNLHKYLLKWKIDQSIWDFFFFFWLVEYTRLWSVMDLLIQWMTKSFSKSASFYNNEPHSYPWQYVCTSDKFLTWTKPLYKLGNMFAPLNWFL